ncbi:MAG: BCCT family transporter [Marinisporobacter sp.]|jgi:glycine betaine transporter|nr:BCCT family transporter [Marinisporobacter sp.]
MLQKFKKDTVFYGSLLSMMVMIFWTIFNIDTFEKGANQLLGFLISKFSWFYLGIMLSFVYFCVWLACSKYGKIKLGKDEDEAEYPFLSWLSMLFSAGMGIGLIFWGVAENPLIIILTLWECRELQLQQKYFLCKNLFFIGEYLRGLLIQY